MAQSDQGLADERPRHRRTLAGECAGACGDFGTFIPHVVGAMTVAGLAPGGVLFGFGVTLIASGAFYGVPMAVQPMKAVSAILLTGKLTPEATAAAGLIIGGLFLILGATGLVGRMARLIPQSVTAGLQLGLGLVMGWLGLMMAIEVLWIGLPAATLLLVLPRFLPRVPVVPLVLIATTGVGLASGLTAWPAVPSLSFRLPTFALPETWLAMRQALELAVLPQLPLTLTNAILVTAVLSRDLFPGNGRPASVRNLALTTGTANVLLAPFGAMPMCHGAGEVAAQHRFGARSGLAPIILGIVLLAFALCCPDGAAALLGAVPVSAVGAMLLVAGTDLAVSKRLFDARPACWPAIGIAAGATVLVSPSVGLVAGVAIEGLRGLTSRSRSAGGRLT